jgi:hypothetical protein
MGCGMNHIKTNLQEDTRYKFISIDYISTDKDIIECNITNMKEIINDYSVDICILS